MGASAVVQADGLPPQWLGSSRRERTLRRLVGGATATGTVTVALTLLLGRGDDGDLLDLLLIVVVAGVVCTGLTWPFERRWRAARPVARYALLGGIAAAAAVLAIGDGEYALPGLAVAVPFGVVGGAVGAAVARRTPTGWLLPTLTASTLALGGAVGGAWLDARPPYPGSWLVVTGPSSPSGARPLAERVADGLRASKAPVSEQAWAAVAANVVTLREPGMVRIGYAQERPVERQITVDVNGDTACVTATVVRVTVADGACPS